MSDLDYLIVIPETLITPDDHIKSRAPNLAVDAANGRVHIVWFDRQEENDILLRSASTVELHYRVMNLNGGEIVPITTLTSGLTIDVDWGEPEIALDGNGNAHIVYAKDLDGNSEEDEDRDDREVFYTVVAVSGNSATTLVNDTMITAEDGHASTRAQLAIDANGMVHVIWHDKRFKDAGTGENEIFYCKLNPNPGSGTVGFVIAEAQVTPDNGMKSNQKGIAIDNCGRVHIAWGEGWEWYDDEPEPLERDLYYQVFDSSGGSLNEVISAYRVTGSETLFLPCYWHYSAGSSSRNPHLAILGDNRVLIAFSGGLFPNIEYNDEEGEFDIYLAILDVPPCPERPIPSMNTWGIIFLLMLLSGIGFWVFVRRTKTG
ncbi:MAG: hypothetical protein JRJ85_14250 [Deltaproteobacteria bacterium]|nr:hypothetical protein [Deltaproteobacteria bacterium]